MLNDRGGVATDVRGALPEVPGESLGRPLEVSWLRSPQRAGLLDAGDVSGNSVTVRSLWKAEECCIWGEQVEWM